MTTYAAPRPAPPLLRTLMASKPNLERSFTESAGSLVLHVGLIAAAIAITTNVKTRAMIDETAHLLIPIASKVEEPPPPPPPLVVDQQVQSALPPAEVPKGFQTLTIPTVIPPDIPPPTAGAEISERDFSGEGVEGGRAWGTTRPDRIVTTEDISAAPVFTPYTVQPELLNRDDVARALVSHFPRLLRDAGIGGIAILWLFIDEHGVVLKTVIKQSSGQGALDQAAQQVGMTMRFSAAQNRDQKVKVWIQLPVTFEARN